MMRYSTRFLILLVVVSAVLQLSDQYHFSNGWIAGRKRSDVMPKSQQCMLSEQTRALYLHLLEKEIQNVNQVCPDSQMDQKTFKEMLADSNKD